MGDQDEAGNRGGQDEFPAPSAPDNRGGKKSQAKRKVVIEEADVKRPTIGEHHQARQQEPRWTARDGGDERKCPPKEDEHAYRYSNFLRHRQPKQIPKL